MYVTKDAEYLAIESIPLTDVKRTWLRRHVDPSLRSGHDISAHCFPRRFSYSTTPVYLSVNGTRALHNSPTSFLFSDDIPQAQGPVISKLSTHVSALGLEAADSLSPMLEGGTKRLNRL